jgi:molecular chaperone GrpE (heat shock protein)
MSDDRWVTDGTGTQPDGLPDVSRRLDELTDLFRRRLVEDREKQRAFDALYRELTQARAMADGQYLTPMIRRLINVVDRLRATPSEFAPSIADELAEILAMYEVEEIRPQSALFDPAAQEVAKMIDTAVPEEDGTIAGVHRSGWHQGTRLLRPALVDVHRYRAHEQSGQGHDRFAGEGAEGEGLL